MAGSALILGGNLKLGTTAGTAIDITSEVTAMTLTVKRAVINIPPTWGGARATYRAGADTYEIKFDYFSSDIATSGTTVWQMLWAASIDTAQSPAGSLYYEGTFNGGVVSATNPKYYGRLLVTGADLGGTANDLSKDSQTFMLIDRPGVATSTNATTIAVGSNGFSLPQGTINVAATAGFLASGAIQVVTSTGLQTVGYTALTGTTFTGCTGGTGSMTTGGAVTQ